MEILAILIFSVFIATADNDLPDSKDNNKSEKVKIVQTKEIEETKPEPIQKEETKPEPIQKEEGSWLNIILYALGAIVAIVAGTYFFVRRKIASPINVTDVTRQEFNEGSTSKPLDQEETQEPVQEETQEPAQEETQEPAQEETQEPAQEETQEPAQEETQSNENIEEKSSEDDPSDNNKK